MIRSSGSALRSVFEIGVLVLALGLTCRGIQFRGDNVAFNLEGTPRCDWVTQISFRLIGVLILSTSLPTFAGPPLPCVKAVSSVHGNFLVISDAQLKPERENIFTVQQVSLGVFPKENSINDKEE